LSLPEQMPFASLFNCTWIHSNHHTALVHRLLPLILTAKQFAKDSGNSYFKSRTIHFFRGEIH